MGDTSMRTMLRVTTLFISLKVIKVTISAVNQLIQYNFCGSILHVVHLLYPHHWIFGFQLFRYALLFCKLLYQLEKKIFSLPVNLGKIGVKLSCCHKCVIEAPALLADKLQPSLAP